MTDTGPGAHLATWGFPAAAGWRTPGGGIHQEGACATVFEWASVTKVVTALATWVAVEEGTVGWDDAAGPPGSTLRHLLAHASGLGPEGDAVLAPPGRRRIYSNRGFEVAAAHVGRAAGMDFWDYAREAVLAPLGMTSTSVAGSPASGAKGPLPDLLALAGELLQPRLVDGATWDEVTRPAFPGLGGVLPGFGSHRDNAWGLGVEIRDHKDPHWTGRRNSPATFGHFGRAGSFVWVDPVAGVAAASLGARPFGEWAASAWPELSDAVLEAARPTA